MLRHPADPDRILVEPFEVDGETLPAVLEEHAGSLRAITTWARDFLCRPHPELGRKGNVCPFAQPSIDRRRFYLAVFPGAPDDPAEVAEVMRGYRDWFLRLSPGGDERTQLATILVLFPGLAAEQIERLIDTTQQALKQEYVRDGLMIGEFHDLPPAKGGLWNPGFRPLRSPVPMLVIRHMVPTDFPFLADERELVRAYLRRFGEQAPGPLRDAVRQARVRHGLDGAERTDRAEHPLSFGQERLWFMERMDAGSAVYHVPDVVRLRGPLDPALLRRAFDEIVLRHDSLRAVFRERNGTPVQLVRPGGRAGFAVVDLDGPDREHRARQLLDDEVRKPFDLRSGPLIRVLVLRLSDTEHLLAVTMHHIASDGWSVGVLREELSAWYDALRRGERPDLPALPLTYGEYAARQRAELDSASGAKRLDRIVSGLRGAPALLDLPADHPRPAVAAHDGAIVEFDLDAALTGRVTALAGTLGVTPFTVLLAAYQALLARCSGQDDVVIGAVMGHRPGLETEPMIGYFLNTVAIRARFTPGTTFAGHVAAVSDSLIDALGDADIPFERVVEALQPERSLGHSPVYQAGFNGHLAAGTPLTLAGTVTETVPLVHTGTAKLDLMLGAARAGDRLECYLEYRTDLFERATIERFAAYLTTFLTGVTADPARRVAEVALAGRAVPDRPVAVPEGPSTLDAIAARTAGRPGAVAVRDDDGTLTYAELDAAANRLAHRLRAHGVRRGDVVALAPRRGRAMIVGILGIWRAGGAYLPLDLSWPAERLRGMVTDAGARIAVVHEADRPATPVDTCLAVDAPEPAGPPPGPPPVEVGEDDIAYVAYTSGSTGTPKGVAVPHRGVTNVLTRFGPVTGLSAADVWASVTPLSFDMSVRELLVPLVTGGQVVIVGTADAEDPVRLRARLTGCAATVLQATPTRWRMLLATGEIPATVRLRLCGGEPVTGDLVAALSGPGTEVWNVYGPTESTMIASAGPLTPGRPVTLGPALPGTAMYLLDRTMRPVPPGVVGEIYIGGPGPGGTYLGRPALTARQFVPDPFAARPGSRMYATGDLGRYTADGRLRILGRADGQVKVRGYRIELGEIEAVLRAHPDVRDAAVAARPVSAGDVRLAGYVVPAGPVTDATWRAIRRHLAGRLPEYMIPSALVPITALPLTRTGKTDRSALPEPSWDDVREGAAVAARDDVERVQVDLWQTLLGVPEIGVHDDFFALGGHSLLAARLLARTRELFGVEVPMRTLFQARTVAGFVERLRELEPAPGMLAEAAHLWTEIAAMGDDEVAELLGENQTGAHQ